MALPVPQKVTLEDKYTLEEGRVFVTGSQALVRLPLLMRARDAAAGRNTAGFVSGYRGSPLARLDQQLWRARKFLEESHIKFTPGVNEDLGATAVWGSQHTPLFEGARFDGVFGMWYGKGPGVDRTMDVIRHANAAGTSELGGVLALAGDDHGCDSSTLGHQSDHDFISAMVPVLHPANVQEYLDYGILGWEMSRYAGCWVAMKCVTEVVESSASVDVAPNRVNVTLPRDYSLPEGGLNIRRPDDRFIQEHRLYDKIEAAKAFARANRLDRLTIGGKTPAKLGILTTGKAYTDFMQALEDMGLTEKDAAAAGIRVYKVGMVWPLEPEGLRGFVEGLEEILVIEEKRGVLENQLEKYLFQWGLGGVKVTGKRNAKGAWQLPAAGEISPAMIVKILAAKLNKTPAMQARLRAIEEREATLKKHTNNVVRLPYFCSGCPHNTSTKLPEGSRAMVGIGCHFMVQWMNRNSEITTHMGGEGVTWIGQAPFTDENHMFMNLGDGTYFHSGSLAVRATVAAGVNITYKILYNDAVAMTGGQPVDGSLTVPQITRQMAAEGVKKIAVVTDEPAKYKKHPKSDPFAPGVTVHHREHLEKVHLELRETPGCTILIYDQTCAAEKRRRRKRGTCPDPQKRVFINDLVCEGCGDCSMASNCVSVEPLETEFGRKRTINQSSCNKDYSCVNGFCPSFVTVLGGKVKKLKAGAGDTESLFATLPLPTPSKLEKPLDILITGIGGTGVVTIGAVLGMAAHIEGKGVTVLDQAGLAQKNGAVVSYLRLGPTPESLHAVRTGAAKANVLLGCDLVVADSPRVLERLAPGHTRGVLNTFMTPTAAFTLNPDVDFHARDIRQDVLATLGEENTAMVEATRLATALLGDTIATNMFVAGYAWQRGLIPLSLEAIFKAIDLNGVAVDFNKQAFNWGRLAAHNLPSVEQIAKSALPEEEHIAESLEELIGKRADFLTDYQKKAYADRYKNLVEKARRAEEAKTPNHTAFTEAVARGAFKLMAYKDEYEVARLYTNGDFLKKLKAQFEGDFRLNFHLAPPLLARRDDKGHLKKMAFGPWMFGIFRLVAPLRRLRGTPLDIFGLTSERRTERRLIEEYFSLVEEVAPHLEESTHATAVSLARLPLEIRGFGHVKEAALAKATARKAELLAALKGSGRETPVPPQKVVVQ